MVQRQYLHALNKIPGLGSQAMRKLLAYFDNPESAWNSSFSELRSAGIGEKLANAIIRQRPTINIQKAWDSLDQSGISLITMDDEEYPILLKEIHNPPSILYKRGQYDWNSKPIITIVGSRHCTPYGERVALKFANELVSSGFCVASGLAFGIDAAAHKGALEAHGPTIAVLGNSLDDASIAPRTHLPLAQNILQHQGALLSEYPPLTNATPSTFPARNRILAGISQGTIVVESASKSGSLITARFALEFGREVFAVPGSIFSEASAGPHELIRKGAKITGSIKDILEEIKPQIQTFSQPTKPDISLSPEETKLFSCISPDPVHIDKILKTTTLETSQVQSILVLLEMKGLVKNIGGMNYIRL